MKIAFQNSLGFYCTAEGGGNAGVSFNRTAVGPWETFTVEGKALKCDDGVHYLTFDKDQTIRAIATDSNAWEHVLTLPVKAGTQRWQAEDGGGAFLATVTLAGGSSNLDPLGVTGYTFANNWQYRGATDFRLLKDILDGKDVSAVIQQRKDAGANIHRVLTMANNLFQLEPDHYSDADLTKAVQYLNGLGQRIELVALADCAGKPLGWQQSHLARIGGAAGQLNLCELGNEINNFWQNVNPAQFNKPSNCLSSRGDTTGYGNYCPLPAWDYSTIHGDRDEKWLQNIAKAGMDLVKGFPGYAGTQGPLVHNEPTKAPYPRTSPNDWFIAGIQGSVWRGDGIGGVCFHCDSGLQSLLWNGLEQASAINFYKGMTQGTLA